MIDRENPAVFQTALVSSTQQVDDRKGQPERGHTLAAMPDQRLSPLSDHSEEGRAFLQTRVALFWKVIFFIILIGSGLGVVGAVASPGVDLLITIASTVNAGIFWWLASTGERSIRASRWMDSGGLPAQFVHRRAHRALLARDVRERS